ncbi:MAG: NOL1/NOP2/sun family putative RNA methylase [Candidatus Altiarchaeales archaeon]|nr:NOL1/NOP2/sun family putative RNA methylase [Candidatus Altiarchaeales archaeon]MBD3415865.1 NOL1/NOP2/sun family putative RNA methylase [Candidatus Altiarchaeales archaeon]
MRVPAEFRRYHQDLLGGEYDDYMDYFTRPQSRYSIRVNTLKSSMREVKRLLGERNIEYGKVSWCNDGLWVGTDDLDLMEHQLGLYYIQNASSFIAPLVLGPGDRVLDLCAAPGGKTTHLAQVMENRGLLVANDNSPARLRGLVYNIQRCGASNAAVLKEDGCRIDKLGLNFDRILVDAPCSSVGTLRQSHEVLRKWSLKWVKQLTTVQKKMVVSAYDSLCEGGRMVYSTCTTTKEENEDVIEHLLDEREGAELFKVDLGGLKVRRGLTENTWKCARIHPHDNDTDPHFIAEVRKSG